jgi:hypothetical protein
LFTRPSSFEVLRRRSRRLGGWTGCAPCGLRLIAWPFGFTGRRPSANRPSPGGRASDRSAGLPG